MVYCTRTTQFSPLSIVSAMITTIKFCIFFFAFVFGFEWSTMCAGELADFQLISIVE